MDCPEGYRPEEPLQDDDGLYVSSSCKCLPLCPTIPDICPQGCEKQMKDGCPYCQCLVESPTCPKVACLMYCPLGYENDVNGCPTCKCKSICPTIACDLICPNGYQLDSSGCPICKCNPYVSECLDVSKCELLCPYGFEKDEDGCCSCSYNNMLPYRDAARSKRRL